MEGEPLMGWDVIVPWVGLTLMLLIGAMLWVTLIRGVERSLLRPPPRTGWRSLVGRKAYLLQRWQQYRPRRHCDPLQSWQGLHQSRADTHGI